MGLDAAKCRPGQDHQSWTVGLFVFCSSCGAHSQYGTQRLAQDCRGSRPREAVAWDRLRRMWSGCHPGDGHGLREFGKPLRSTPFGAFALDVKCEALEVLPMSSDDECYRWGSRVYKTSEALLSRIAEVPDAIKSVDFSSGEPAVPSTCRPH